MHGNPAWKYQQRIVVIIDTMTFYTTKGDDGTTGMLGEGRVPKYHIRMEALGALDEEALVDILTKPRNALVRQYQRFFEMEDAELEFTPDALSALARKALKHDTGARALRSITASLMSGAFIAKRFVLKMDAGSFRLPDAPDATEVRAWFVEANRMLDGFGPRLFLDLYQATGSPIGFPETRRKRTPSSPVCTMTFSPRSNTTSVRLSAMFVPNLPAPANT